MKQESGGRGSYKTAAQRRIDNIVAQKNKNAQTHKSDAARVESIKYKKRPPSYTPNKETTYKAGDQKKASDDKYMAAVAGRKKMGTYAGDYYGPDELKGNVTKLRKWRDAGKPPVKGWLNRQRNSG